MNCHIGVEHIHTGATTCSIAKSIGYSVFSFESDILCMVEYLGLQGCCYSKSLVEIQDFLPIEVVEFLVILFFVTDVERVNRFEDF